MLRTWHRGLLLGCILASCVAGAWLSGQLARLHDGGWGEDAGDPGFLARLCGPVAGGGGGCEGTARSAWSQVNLPVPALVEGPAISLRKVRLPVAFLGLSYFAGLGAWFALVGGPRPIGAAWHRLALAVATCGVGASAFFVGLMAFGGAPWCVGCVAVHIINLVLMAAIWVLCVIPAAGPALPTSDRPSTRSTLAAREAWTAVAVASLLVAGLYSHRQESLAHRQDVARLEPYKEMVLALQSDPGPLIGAYLAQPWRRIEARQDEVDPKSRHHLVVFTDFECGACQLNSQVIREQVMKAFGEDLAVWIRHFPLCNHCNEQVKEAFHPGACRAAYAAEAARSLRGRLAFTLVHDLLFANRDQLSDPVYRYVAGQIGIDPGRFLARMEDPDVRQVVRDDIALGRELGVDGTPTMFLNGRRIPSLCATSEFWKAAARLPVPPEARP